MWPLALRRVTSLMTARGLAQSPQPHCLVHAAGGQGVPVGAERHRPDVFGVTEQRNGGLPGSQIPQLHNVSGGGGQCAAIRAESHRDD
jgi:hypothetical protein